MLGGGVDAATLVAAYTFDLFYEYIDLECVRVLVIYRIDQAEYVIHIRAAASHSTCMQMTSQRTTPLTQQRSKVAK